MGCQNPLKQAILRGPGTQGSPVDEGAFYREDLTNGEEVCRTPSLAMYAMLIQLHARRFDASQPTVEKVYSGHLSVISREQQDRYFRVLRVCDLWRAATVYRVLRVVCGCGARWSGPCFNQTVLGVGVGTVEI